MSECDREAGADWRYIGRGTRAHAFQGQRLVAACGRGPAGRTATVGVNCEPCMECQERVPIPGWVPPCPCKQVLRVGDSCLLCGKIKQHNAKHEHFAR